MLIDGGVWANNPLMLAIAEAMICYDVPRERIKVLSIGCGDEPYYVTRRMIGGGLWQWRKVIGGAMRAQSLAATNQARLLLGPAMSSKSSRRLPAVRSNSTTISGRSTSFCR